MATDRLLSREAVAGAFLSIFWALWLQRLGQAVFESSMLRSGRADLVLDAAKSTFVVGLLLIVLFVIWLLLILATRISAIQSLGMVGQTEQSDIAAKVLQLRRHSLRLETFISFGVVSAFVVAVPVTAFWVFNTPTAYEVVIAAVMLPLVLGLLIALSEL